MVVVAVVMALTRMGQVLTVEAVVVPVAAKTKNQAATPQIPSMDIKVARTIIAGTAVVAAVLALKVGVAVTYVVLDKTIKVWVEMASSMTLQANESNMRKEGMVAFGTGSLVLRILKCPSLVKGVKGLEVNARREP